MKFFFSTLFLVLMTACGTTPTNTKNDSDAVKAMTDTNQVTRSENEEVLKNDPLFKTMSAAIETHDEKKLRKVLDPINKKPESRTADQNNILNSGLYLATLDGLKCNTRIVHVLEKVYQARVVKFNALSFISVDKKDASAALCKDVMANSLPRMQDPEKTLDDVSNQYVKLINDGAEKQLEKKAAAYNRLLTTASYMIQEACKKSETDPVCLMKPAYQAFANLSKISKTKSVKRNANAVLDILK